MPLFANYSNRRFEISRDYVLEALIRLHKPSRSHEIHTKCVEIIKEETKNEYSKRGSHFDISNEKANFRQTQKTLSDKAINKRTVQRRLQDLMKEGLVNCTGYYLYSLIDKAKLDIRYFAKQFGGFALTDLMSIQWPTISSLEANIKNLVELFGVYVLYCFIEAARPAAIPDNDTNKEKILGVAIVDKHKEAKRIWEEKEKLVRWWIKNVFSPLNMYEYFLTTFQNQPGEIAADKNFQKYREDYEHYKNNLQGKPKPTWIPPSTQDLRANRFYFLAASDFEPSYGRKRVWIKDDKGKETSKSKIVSYDSEEVGQLSEEELEQQYELSEEEIKRLTLVLNKKYRKLYKKLLEARAVFLGRPKEHSQLGQSNKFGSFDSENEETIIHRK